MLTRCGGPVLPDAEKRIRPNRLTSMGREKLTYIEKVEKITSDDRGFVRCDLSSLADWIRERYPAMNYREINRFLHEKLDTSV